ncbi:MAG: 5,10-methylene tetrahydromethanopterin reductase, partial [Janthinobacterium lividum]
DEALEVDGLTRADSGTYGHGPDATIGELIDAAADLSREPMFVHGDAKSVADQVEEWVEEFDLDGFLLKNYVHPGTVADFGRFLVPELQRRGRYRTEYEGSTLREHFFGAGHTQLAASHPGAAFRRAGAGA